MSTPGDPAGPEPAELPDQALARVAAWRAQAPGHAPLRLGLIEALARRTAQQAGPARAVLEARLAALLAEHQAEFPAELASALPSPSAPAPRAPSGLAELVAQLGGAVPSLPAAAAGDGAEPALGPAGAAAAPPELKTVRYFRSTWQRLGVRQRLVQSLAQVPDNAGPLNTQRLLHQALLLMDEHSPEALQHLVTQVETLLWLEQASGMAPPERKGGRRG